MTVKYPVIIYFAQIDDNLKIGRTTKGYDRVVNHMNYCSKWNRSFKFLFAFPASSIVEMKLHNLLAKRRVLSNHSAEEYQISSSEVCAMQELFQELFGPRLITEAKEMPVLDSPPRRPPPISWEELKVIANMAEF